MVALAAAIVVPHLASRQPGHGQLVDGIPPVDVLVAASVIIGAVTTVAVYLAVRRDLKLPARVALYAAGYEALVVPRQVWPRARRALPRQPARGDHRVAIRDR